MEKEVWAVKSAKINSKELETLLYEDWKPFAVTLDYIVWLRKRVRVEVREDDKELLS